VLFAPARPSVTKVTVGRRAPGGVGQKAVGPKGVERDPVSTHAGETVIGSVDRRAGWGDAGDALGQRRRRWWQTSRSACGSRVVHGTGAGRGTHTPATPPVGVWLKGCSRDRGGPR